MVAVAYLLIGDQGVAEDLAQEAFGEAHRYWDKVSGYDKPGAWLRRVVINKASSRRRRMATETRLLTRLGGHRPSYTELSLPDVELWDEVRRLPRRQAQVIVLQYWDDLPLAEIASILDCGEETVKTHLKRGRARLAERLGRGGRTVSIDDDLRRSIEGFRPSVDGLEVPPPEFGRERTGGTDAAWPSRVFALAAGLAIVMAGAVGLSIALRGQTESIEAATVETTVVETTTVATMTVETATVETTVVDSATVDPATVEGSEGSAVSEPIPPVASGSGRALSKAEPGGSAVPVVGGPSVQSEWEPGALEEGGGGPGSLRSRRGRYRL